MTAIVDTLMLERQARTLDVRIKEHKRAVRYDDRNNGSMPTRHYTASSGRAHI